MTRTLAIVVAILAGATVANTLAIVILASRVDAASRPGTVPAIPATTLNQGRAVSRNLARSQTEAPPAVEDSTGGASQPVTEPDAVMGGLASYVAPLYGPRYLALPDGPGVTVTICAGSRCVTRTSTDAGPSLAMQRAGRIADVSYADFGYLCRCSPPSVGVIEVLVEYGASPDVTPPATDP